MVLPLTSILELLMGIMETLHDGSEPMCDPTLGLEDASSWEFGPINRKLRCEVFQILLSSAKRTVTSFKIVLQGAPIFLPFRITIALTKMTGAYRGRSARGKDYAKTAILLAFSGPTFMNGVFLTHDGLRARCRLLLFVVLWAFCERALFAGA